MFNSNKSIIETILSFSNFALILPIILGTNVNQAVADDIEILRTCKSIQGLIKDLDEGSPTRVAFESKYADLNCHKYLKNKADARNCKKILAGINDPNMGSIARNSLVTVYKQACVNPVEN